MSALPFYATLRRTLYLTAVVLMPPLAQAQTSAALPAAIPAPIPAAKPAVTVPSKPGWADLNPMQQQSLRPLAANWNGLSAAQKRKWLEVSKSYPNLSAADQAVMRSRMVEWVAMSPQQRAAARLNFGKAKELSNQLTADEKKAKWQTYQSLSPAEKAKLASKAAPKPAGAATAVKPVAPQKLAVTAKGMPPSPETPPASPAITPTGDTLQNMATPRVPAK